MADVTVWFNPKCSKCRTAQGILAEKGVEAEYVRYLESSPSRDELERVLKLLGTDDPMTIVQTGEDRWKELAVDRADRDAVLEALAANPILIERPIVIRGDKAVVARPPEKVLELLS